MANIRRCKHWSPEVEPQPTTYAAAVLEMKKWDNYTMAWLDKKICQGSAST